MNIIKDGSELLAPLFMRASEYFLCKELQILSGEILNWSQYAGSFGGKEEASRVDGLPRKATCFC
jgi:hypothetical protein